MWSRAPSLWGTPSVLLKISSSRLGSRLSHVPCSKVYRWQQGYVNQPFGQRPVRGYISCMIGEVMRGARTVPVSFSLSGTSAFVVAIVSIIWAIQVTEGFSRKDSVHCLRLVTPAVRVTSTDSRLSLSKPNCSSRLPTLSIGSITFQRILMSNVQHATWIELYIKMRLSIGKQGKRWTHGHAKITR